MFELNLYEIEAELRALFPSLIIPSPLLLIGSGFNSIVLEAGGSIIFRVGKNSIAQEGYEKEMACLSIIAPHIPFLVPIPKWHIKRSPYFPFGVIAYDKLPGVPSQDFATLLHVGEKFVKFVIDAYQSLGGKLDENFGYRVERLWEAREFEGLHYAIKFDDPIELKDALRKFRHGPILRNIVERNKGE